MAKINIFRLTFFLEKPSIFQNTFDLAFWNISGCGCGLWQVVKPQRRLQRHALDAAAGTGGR